MFLSITDANIFNQYEIAYNVKATPNEKKSNISFVTEIKDPYTQNSFRDYNPIASDRDKYYLSMDSGLVNDSQRAEKYEISMEIKRKKDEKTILFKIILNVGAPPNRQIKLGSVNTNFKPFRKNTLLELEFDDDNDIANIGNYQITKTITHSNGDPLSDDEKSQISLFRGVVAKTETLQKRK